MKQGKDFFVVYGSKKILKRLTILGKKNFEGEQWHESLLIGIQDWAKRYPHFNDKASPYSLAYAELAKKGVQFPKPKPVAKPKPKMEERPSPTRQGGKKSSLNDVYKACKE